MSRSFTPAGVSSLFAQTTDQIWLVLLTIHADVDIHLVNNNEAVTSKGRAFIPYPFDIVLPDDTLDRMPQAQLVIDNSDQMLVDTLRKISAPPKFTIELVRFDAPDTIEMTVSDLIMRSVNWDASTISASLELDDVFNQPFPSGSGSYTPRQFPGMF